MDKLYYCGVCQTPHKTIEDRAACEAKCLCRLKKLEEEAKRNELEAKRKESAEAIYAALGDVNEMIAKHLKEYHNLSLKKSYPYLQNIFNRHWLF